ncbi:hypothetical protein A2U01_0083716 [Trifolium medium]|uniref:Uncharacterized protein n=1 Tax=Trifolium medium TaxID=97028 RepID=A0A392TMQ5_9FABA|nr:hypothetical protein [Trifolium medium]
MAEGYGATGRSAIEEGMAPVAGLPLMKAWLPFPSLGALRALVEKSKYAEFLSEYT